MTEYTGATPTSNMEPSAQATSTPEASDTFTSGHWRSTDPMTPTAVTPDSTTANKTAQPNPMPMPTPTPCSASGNASGMSAAGIAAIFGVVSSILLPCIAVWQGFCYPRREHKNRMTRQDIELQTVEMRYRSAEDELAHQREARAALGEPSSNSGVIG
ncbi:hypothetical protein FRB94_007318 [Tulasnella sp. JGI-2019a]|nr:hypothetical protein FRB94_007318 [Tulasnella sp. JGI-2019a]KAG9013278.1 hypothetical protein FRB93_000801 [Tulasnella sp. JGI-2019a]KAG9024805.1 hypothetical protein FRB95_011044 [Tulasnella sp. JGI-2019a]